MMTSRRAFIEKNDTHLLELKNTGHLIIADQENAMRVVTRIDSLLEFMEHFISKTDLENQDPLC